MINIKTKLLIIVMSVVLFVNSYDLRVFASTDYDHDRLLEYDGYAEAMYESIVEQTTFISGRYTENKDYVNESINQITDYAKGWWDEYMRISELPPKEKIREMVNAGGGYLLTVGDFVKNLFSDYEETVPNITQPDYGFFENAFTWGINYEKRPVLTLKNGWTVEFEYNGKKSIHTAKQGANNDVFVHLYNDYMWDIYYRFYVAGFPTMGPKIGNDPSAEVTSARNHFNANSGSVGGMMSLIYKAGGSVKVFYSGEEVPFDPTIPKRSITYINNYVNENSPQVAIPKPSAYLSCPDGTRINMKINGGTFLDVKGNIMQVDKNGTATVDSQICNLGWEKPKVQYLDDGTDRVAVTQPDGEVINAETGDTIIPGEDDFDDELQDGCGTLCALGKLLSGLGSIVKAIAAIPLKILDGLFELVKKILIPEENFWTTNLDSLKTKFFHDELKEVQNGVESLENVGGGQFGDVTGSLMGVDNLKIIDSSSINMSMDTLHSWIRGFFYPLLLFFNINQMYRVIRGTSLIGIGGKKEE